MRPILVTGATGYVGGRLLDALEQKGLPVRCLARRPEFLRDRVKPSTQIFRGDLLQPASLEEALRGVGVAYYLAHSMGSTGSFDREEAESARNFAEAARQAGIDRIVYLGGLGSDEKVSPHLRSRHEVGRILQASGIPTIEFRASIIVGSGSLSFEMIRTLVNRLPVMTTPKWVRVHAQPIAIEDVIQYLVEAAKVRLDGSRLFEIGGPQRMSYLDLMREYGRQKGLKRLIIPVPVLTPGLSSLWLGLVTPLYARVGRKLIESIRHETVVTDHSALSVFSVKPMPISEAIRRALAFEDHEFAATRWSDAQSASYGKPVRMFRRSRRIVETRRIEIAAPASRVFAEVERLGGANGWYHANWLWKVRGYWDLLAGGVGLRRGRRDPTKLAVGDVLDWWRVESIERGKLLRLSAEMKLPGYAWLQFETKEKDGLTCLTQTAIFEPSGPAGLFYWYALYLPHRYVFRGLLTALARRVLASEKPSAV